MSWSNILKNRKRISDSSRATDAEFFFVIEDIILGGLSADNLNTFDDYKRTIDRNKDFMKDIEIISKFDRNKLLSLLEKNQINEEDLEDFDITIPDIIEESKKIFSKMKTLSTKERADSKSRAVPQRNVELFTTEIYPVVYSAKDKKMLEQKFKKLSEDGEDGKAYKTPYENIKKIATLESIKNGSAKRKITDFLKRVETYYVNIYGLTPVKSVTFDNFVEIEKLPNSVNDVEAYRVIMQIPFSPNQLRDLKGKGKNKSSTTYINSIEDFILHFARASPDNRKVYDKLRTTGSTFKTAQSKVFNLDTDSYEKYPHFILDDDKVEGKVSVSVNESALDLINLKILWRTLFTTDSKAMMAFLSSIMSEGDSRPIEMIYMKKSGYVELNNIANYILSFNEGDDWVSEFKKYAKVKDSVMARTVVINDLKNLFFIKNKDAKGRGGKFVFDTVIGRGKTIPADKVVKDSPAEIYKDRNGNITSASIFKFFKEHYALDKEGVTHLYNGTGYLEDAKDVKNRNNPITIYSGTSRNKQKMWNLRVKTVEDRSEKTNFPSKISERVNRKRSTVDYESTIPSALKGFEAYQFVKYYNKLVERIKTEKGKTEKDKDENLLDMFNEMKSDLDKYSISSKKYNPEKLQEEKTKEQQDKGEEVKEMSEQDIFREYGKDIKSFNSLNLTDMRDKEFLEASYLLYKDKALHPVINLISELDVMDKALPIEKPKEVNGVASPVSALTMSRRIRVSTTEDDSEESFIAEILQQVKGNGNLSQNILSAFNSPESSSESSGSVSLQAILGYMFTMYEEFEEFSDAEEIGTLAGLVDKLNDLFDKEKQEDSKEKDISEEQNETTETQIDETVEKIIESFSEAIEETQIVIEDMLLDIIKRIAEKIEERDASYANRLKDNLESKTNDITIEIKEDE